MLENKKALRGHRRRAAQAQTQLGLCGSAAEKMNYQGDHSEQQQQMNQSAGDVVHQKAASP
jgi:hypothetical protein